MSGYANGCVAKMMPILFTWIYLAVASPMKGEPTFHSGQSVVSKSTHYARLRKRLQKTGTRCATRRLVAIAGRERRLKQDANHVVSKRIVDAHPHALIGLENLTDIRERTKRKKGKKATKKQRQANARHSKWAFAELQRMLAYKATCAESMAVKVDAHYTSQACPMCGYTSQDNRPGKGLLFVCQTCHYPIRPVKPLRSRMRIEGVFLSGRDGCGEELVLDISTVFCDNPSMDTVVKSNQSIVYSCHSSFKPAWN